MGTGASDLIRGSCRPVAHQAGIARDALTGYGEARLEVDRLVAHQAHKPTHPFLFHRVAGQAQVVSQAEYALEVVHCKLQVEQAHRFQVARTFATGAGSRSYCAPTSRPGSGPAPNRRPGPGTRPRPVAGPRSLGQRFF